MFKALYEKALTDLVTKDQAERSNDHNHPSEITNCLRCFWYKVKGTKPSNPPSIGMMAIWQIGHSLHDFLGKLTGIIPEIEEYTLEKPIEVPGIYNLGGHSDLVVKMKDGNWYVVDFKTISKTKLKDLKKKGLPEGYKWQVLIYMWALKQMKPRKFKDLDKAYVLFLDKSPLPDEIMEATRKTFYKAESPFHEEIVEYDEELLETEILPQLEYLEEIRKMANPPDREGSDIKCEKCMFCEYRKLCWKRG